jgi:hypothetical protein
VTLDIICETAFGYKADSLHNPHNELAVAYEKLISLQSGSSRLFPRRRSFNAPSGPNIAKLILLMSVPGAPRFLASNLAYKFRRMFDHIPLFREYTSIVT